MTLGLFPLDVVLFPQIRYPLHIFEPRYKALINECVERGSEFGINLIDNGQLHSIGCSALVVDIVEKYSDGRMDIVVEGVARYKVLDLVPTDAPYTVANVEEYVDSSTEYDETLCSSVLETYNRIVGLVYGLAAPTLKAEELSGAPSFDMAPKSGLSKMQRQMLLELRDENTRLTLLKSHYDDVMPSVDKADMIQRVVKNDGYLRLDEG